MLARRASTGQHALQTALFPTPPVVKRPPARSLAQKQTARFHVPSWPAKPVPRFPLPNWTAKFVGQQLCSPNCTLPSAHQSWEASSAFIGSNANCFIPRALHSKACSGSSSLPCAQLGCQACSGSSSLRCAQVDTVLFVYCSRFNDMIGWNPFWTTAPRPTHYIPQTHGFHLAYVFPFSGLSFTNPWLKSLDENDSKMDHLQKAPANQNCKKYPRTPCGAFFIYKMHRQVCHGTNNKVHNLSSMHDCRDSIKSLATGKDNAEKNNVYILCFYFFWLCFFFGVYQEKKKTWRTHYHTSSILKTKKRGGFRNIMHADQWQDHWITARPPAHWLRWHHIRTVCWAEIYPPSGTRTELVPHRLYLWIFRSATDIRIGFVKGGAGHVSTCTAEWPAQLVPYVVDRVAGSEPRRGDMARHRHGVWRHALGGADQTFLSFFSFTCRCHLMFATRTICFWRAQTFMGETQLPSCLISRHGWATFLAPNVGQRVVPLDLVPCPKKMVILDRAPVARFRRPGRCKLKLISCRPGSPIGPGHFLLQKIWKALGFGVSKAGFGWFGLLVVGWNSKIWNWHIAP